MPRPQHTAVADSLFFRRGPTAFGNRIARQMEYGINAVKRRRRWLLSDGVPRKGVRIEWCQIAAGLIGVSA